MKKLRTASICVHEGAIKDETFGGVNSPIYTSSAYDYRQGKVVYPRYYNTPNQQIISNKIAALEHGEAGIVMSSGMSAIHATMMAVLKSGDHIIFQSDLYGGTYHFIVNELESSGISYSLVDASEVDNFAKAIQENTKAIYVETPSNPLLKITDFESVAAIAKANNLVTIIDNTFASPINQTPIDFGVDIVIHSGTKYLGGHSDICFGAVVSSKEWIEKIHQKSIIYGGSLNASVCALIERSMKTLAIRVREQTKNAQALAEFLESLPMIDKVYYPGLASHENHGLASRLMHGYGAMLSFELRINYPRDLEVFLDNLNMIKPAVSLGGIETTVTSPVATSHAKMPKALREEQGIFDNLFRLSVGIEDIEDLKSDLLYAIEKVETYSLIA